MKRPLLTLAERLILGASLLAFGALLANAKVDGTAESRAEFIAATAGIYACTQTLRQMEKEMLANAGNPERLAAFQQRRDVARRRIDELFSEAHIAVAGEVDRRRLEQLSAITVQADARYARLGTAVAARADAAN